MTVLKFFKLTESEMLIYVRDTDQQSVDELAKLLADGLGDFPVSSMTGTRASTHNFNTPITISFGRQLTALEYLEVLAIGTNAVRHKYLPVHYGLDSGRMV